MNETSYHVGLFLIFPTLLLLAAGLGWKKLASGLIQAFVIAVGGGVVCAFMAGSLMVPHDSSGEWRGLATLFSGVLGFLGGFVVFLIGAIVLLAKKKRLNTERVERSPELLGAAGLGFAIVLFCLVNVFIGSTPSVASTQRLVEQVDANKSTTESRDEIVRRGKESVPFILAVLHRYPYAQKDDHSGRGSVCVARQLELLGRIGGDEAVAELRRWADADCWAYAKEAALCGLAENGDPQVATRIGEFLDQIKPGGNYPPAALFRALGKLKAAGQISAIQRRLDRMLEKELLLNDQFVGRYYVHQVSADGNQTSLASLQAGIIALGQIGTDEAGAALGQFQNQTDTRRRALVTVMLERCPGERAAALLAKALDHPEQLVRRNACDALWHREPKLWSGLPEKWDADAEAKMREAVKAAAVGK